MPPLHPTPPPQLTPEPCALVFAVVLVILCCSAVLVGLHATDGKHNGKLRRGRADGMAPPVERATLCVLLLLLSTSIALFSVLLVWAREGRCAA